MPYSGPGLPYKPEESRLVGFESLAPADDGPGLAGRAIRAGIGLATLPFRMAGALLRLPLRFVGRGGAADSGPLQDSEPAQISDKD